MDLVVTVAVAVAFFALIMASIALHEVGHMVPAKLFGVRVPRYFVGFGPTIRSWRRGDTEYGFKWVPLGGFVELAGMYPPAPGSAQAQGRLARNIEKARAKTWKDIGPDDIDSGRLFYQKPTWQKLIIMAGGPAMNLLIAFLLMLAVTGLYGAVRPQTTVAAVEPCIITDTTRTECAPTDPISPAAAAGMQPGDRIVTFNGTTITGHQQLADLIRDNGDRAADITVLRDGQTVHLTPVHTVVAAVTDPLDASHTVQAGFLGFSPEKELVRGGPGDVIADMWNISVQTFVALAQFPVKVWHVAVGMVTGQPRSVHDPISIIGASSIAGQVAASGQVTAADKAAVFANLLASVNLFLALFNFLPLPPLDGGHIAGALYEWVRRRVAKLTGRTYTYFDTTRLLPVANVMALLLLVAGVVLIVADIVTPLTL